jgi:phenylacetate-CoA ligase
VATSRHLRDIYPFGMFAVPRDSLLRLHASSGTTGKPTVVGYTRGDLHLWSDLMARSLACAGVVPGDIVHNACGYGLFTGGLGAHYGAERLGCTVVPVSGGGTERQVTLLADFGANVLCSTPSYALNIAEVASGMGVDLRRAPQRSGNPRCRPSTKEMAAFERFLATLPACRLASPQRRGPLCPRPTRECIEARR